MRYYPAALALSLLVAISASVGHGAAPDPLDPRAAALLAQGRSALQAGRIDAAIDADEAALAVQPGSVPVLLDLAEARRRQGLQGKALHYYREALDRDPQNLSAIAGEGAALAEKGATEKARRNLARLESLCGSDCPATQTVLAALSRGPAPRVVTADAVKSQPVITPN